MSIYRSIHTTCYSKNAEDIIKAALIISGSGELYNGNSCRRTAARAAVNRAPSGEILVEFDDNAISSWRLVSYVRGNDDIKARQWLAWQIKDSVHHELEVCGDRKHTGWKHNNKDLSQRLTDKSGSNVTIQEAYCLYEMLCSRKNIAKHFTQKLIDTLTGTENDPFKTEMEVQRREQIKLLTKEYEDKIYAMNIDRYGTEIRKRMEAELDQIRAKYRAESSEAMNQLRTERDQKLKELEDQFAAFAAIQLTNPSKR